MSIVDDDIARADFRVIALDETRYWMLEEHATVIERVETVYLYDAARRVHACEITPSYELWPIETRAVYVDNVDDEACDRASEFITRHAYGRVMYVHTHEVDALYERFSLESFRAAKVTGGDRDLETYDELRESVEEYVRCNAQI